MKKSLLFLVSIACTLPVFAQIIQSNGSGGGNWNSPATWVGGVVPQASNSTSIVIRSGDLVSVPSGYSIQADQLSVQANATLRIVSGGLLDILNGSGTDLVLNSSATLLVGGILEFSHNVSSTNVISATTTVQNGGTYRHKYTTAGRVIGAVWEDGSTVEITGLLGQYGPPYNLEQSFYNFVWNTPGMSQTRTINALSNVRGNLTVQSTGSSVLHFFGGAMGRVLYVGGNFQINGNSRVSVSQGGTGNTVNIGGSFVYNSAGVSILTQAGSVVMNVSGDLIHSSGGQLRFAMQNGGFGGVNVVGNTQINGPIVIANGGVGRITFRGGGVHQHTASTGVSGYLQYLVEPGNTLNLASSPLTGSGLFRLYTGATLTLAATPGNGTNANGVLQNSTTQGSIRVPPNNRIFEAGSSIVYNGGAAQQIGAGSHGAADVTIANASGVTVVSNAQITNLTLQTGILSTGIYNLTLTGNYMVEGGQLNPGTGNMVFAGNSIIGGAGQKNFSNVIVNVGSSLVLPNEEIQLTGNLTIDATANIVTGSSTLLLNGNSLQNISANGHVFNNITVNKAGGNVALTSPLSIRGLLSFESGTPLASDGNLTLLSTGDKPAVDAAIGPLLNGASVIGNVTVQRYIGPMGGVYRYISSPVSGATVAMIQDDFPVTGRFSGKSNPCAGCGSGPSLLYYNPFRLNMPANNRFSRYPTSSNQEGLQVGRGYASYMWQTDVDILDLTGLVNSGSVQLPVYMAVSDPPMPDGDGWNLVGNPFPSAISWNGGDGWSRSNVSPTAGVPVSGGGMNYYNFNDGSGDGDAGVIALGQGFWMYASGPNPAVSINENAKITSTRGTYYREKPAERSKQLVVLLSGENGIRKAFLKTNSAATGQFDLEFDAYPLPAEALQKMNVAIVDGDGISLLMHTLPDLQEELVIPLDLEIPNSGIYQLSFQDSENTFDHFERLYLHDRFLGVSVPLSQRRPYSFSATEDGNLSDRFFLSFESEMEQSPEELISVFPNPFEGLLTFKVNSHARVSLEIIDVHGKLLAAHNFISTFELSTEHFSPGFYVARIKTEEGIVIRKIVKE